jgi:murein L,D-transpeptidase YcbB/YkuD
LGFSHECVWVKEPPKFAQLLLGKRNEMRQAKVDNVLEPARSMRINLSKRNRVAILHTIQSSTVVEDPATSS